jgi:hypothetical protein
VVSVPYAPHTTNIFQTLDLSLSGVFKILKTCTEDIESYVGVTVHIAKIIQAIQEICSVLRVQAVSEKVNLE